MSKTNFSAMSTAAYHEAMAEMHSDKSVTHGALSETAPLSRRREFHLAVANAHANIAQQHISHMLSGVGNVGGSKVKKVFQQSGMN